MTFNRRYFLKATAAASSLSVVGVAFGANRSFAAGYPDQPIRLIVPFPPGGQTDVLGRVTAEELSKVIGQRVYVENVAGAGGNLGAASAARSVPDGYTLLFATGGTHGINPNLYARAGYDAVNEFEPVSMAATSANIIVAHPSFEANTLAELIELAKAQPGVIDYASAGNGTTPHMTAELLQTATGMKLNHITYKGSGPAMTDLLGGHVKLMFDGLPSALPHLRANKVKAIAVSSLRRVAAAPTVPAISETVPGFEALAWFAVLTPRGVDRARIDRLNEAMRRAMGSQSAKDRFAELASEPRASTTEELRAHIGAELERWSKTIKQAGIRID